MKKLFFLCAFVFMYMQMQAQLFVVETRQDWTIASADEVTYTVDNVIIIHAPDGSTNIIEIDDEEIQSANIESYYGGATSFNGFSVPSFRETYLIKLVTEQLNNIISEGYSISHISGNTDSFNDNIYYLTVP